MSSRTEQWTPPEQPAQTKPGNSSQSGEELKSSTKSLNDAPMDNRNLSMGSKMARLKAAREEKEGQSNVENKSDDIPKQLGADAEPETRPSQTLRAPSGDTGSDTAQRPDTGQEEAPAEDGERFEAVKITELADQVGLDAADLYDLPLALGDDRVATLSDLIAVNKTAEQQDARHAELFNQQYANNLDVDLAMSVRAEIGGQWTPETQRKIQDKQARDHQMNVEVVQRMFPALKTPEGAKAYGEAVVPLAKEFGVTPERATAPTTWQEVAVWQGLIDARAENKLLKKQLEDVQKVDASRDSARARKSPPKIRRSGKTGNVNGLAQDKRAALSGDLSAKSRYMKAVRERTGRK